MNLEPLYDSLLVERAPEETVSAGGIIIPLQAQAKSVLAIVAFTGEGRLLQNGKVQPLKVRAGDRVLVGKYAGAEYDCNGTTYLLIKEADVVAIVRE